MTYWILGGLAIASGVYSYIMYIRMQYNQLKRELARQEVDQKLAEDNQKVVDALAKVKESERNYDEIRDEYLRNHTDK